MTFRTSSVGRGGRGLPRSAQATRSARCAFAGKLAERQSVMIPAEDPDYEDLGPAFPSWTGPDRDAILQPPKPQIQPSPRILERAAGREADMEAAE